MIGSVEYKDEQYTIKPSKNSQFLETIVNESDVYTGIAGIEGHFDTH